MHRPDNNDTLIVFDYHDDNDRLSIFITDAKQIEPKHLEELLVIHYCQLSMEYTLIFILNIENDPSQPKLSSKTLNTMFLWD